MPSQAFLRIRNQLDRPGRHTDQKVRREVWENYADPVLRPELDEWSRRALELGPQVRTLLGSRGAALVEAGRHQEGKAMLETLVFAKDATPFDRLMSRIFLARAEHALGDSAAAHSLVTEARAIGQTTGGNVIALIERIENEMQTIPSCIMLTNRNARSFSGISP